MTPALYERKLKASVPLLHKLYRPRTVCKQLGKLPRQRRPAASHLPGTSLMGPDLLHTKWMAV